jgi:molybdopterin-biosynthesis enzyme MoeA-like protein
VLALPGKPDEVRAVLEEALPELGFLAALRAVARREVESPTADESSLRPLLDKLHGEFPSVWIDTHPSGSRRRGSRIAITLEASGATAEEAEEAVDSALKRLLALAAGNA